MLGLIEAKIFPQFQQVSRKSVKQWIRRSRDRAARVQPTAELVERAIEVSRIEAEGVCDSKPIMGGRRSLPVDVPIKLLTVHPDLAAKMRNRRSRAARVLQIGRVKMRRMVHSTSVRERKGASRREIASRRCWPTIADGFSVTGQGVNR